MLIERRSFVGGLIGLVAAPAIVKAASLMPIRGEKLILPKPTIVVLNHYADLIVTAVNWKSGNRFPLYSEVTCRKISADPFGNNPSIIVSIHGVHDLRPGDRITNYKRGEEHGS